MANARIVVRPNPDADDCLSVAAHQVSEEYDLEGDLNPEWASEAREEILLTVPFDIEAYGPKFSEYVEIEGAVDINVRMRIGTTYIDGELTLVPDESNVLSRWGSTPDHWVDSKMLSSIQALFDVEGQSTVLEALETQGAIIGGRLL